MDDIQTIVEVPHLPLREKERSVTTTPVKSFTVRVQGLVPREDQITVEAKDKDEASAKAKQIAEDEGFSEVRAINVVEVLGPHKP